MLNALRQQLFSSAAQHNTLLESLGRTQGETTIDVGDGQHIDAPRSRET